MDFEVHYFIDNKNFQSDRKYHIFSFLVDIRLEFKEETIKLWIFKGKAYTVLILCNC